MTLRFVTATRGSQTQFERESLLCRSLARAAQFFPLELRVQANNRLPLGTLFNEAIEAANPDDVLVFVHDDVWVDDWMIGLRLQEALTHFQVVGVAGNTRRQPGQEAWILEGRSRNKDLPFLSGAIVHGEREGAGAVNYFGPLPQQVKWLDGVLLAVRAGTLHTSRVRFDPAFHYHFYDADFCRSCEQAGLRLGTWPIALTHASAGSGFASADWDVAHQLYLNKWVD